MARHTATATAAETIAAKALGFLAQDAERLGRFLALSGLDPASIRQAAQDRSFLPSVLDHILSDERLLLAFAEHEGIPPEAVPRARAALGDPGPAD